MLQIAAERGRIESLQPEKLKRVESICRHIARAIALCLEGNLSESHQVLKDAEKRLSRLRRLEGRLQYQLSSLLAVIIVFLMLGLLTWYATGTGNSILSDLQLYMRVTACGALGGFLSLSLGIRKIDLDPDADWVINSVAGSSRIFISIIASIFVYFGIKAGLILPALDDPSSYNGIYAASVIAGFSETFIPNIIRRISSGEPKDAPESNTLRDSEPEIHKESGNIDGRAGTVGSAYAPNRVAGGV